MTDRVIPLTDKSESGQWVSVGKNKVTGQVAFTERQTFTRTRHIRERSPSGGRAKPEPEKPFTNGTLVVNFPIGPLVRDLRNGYMYHSSGPHSNNFTMQDPGEGLTGTLEFPMNSATRSPRANSSSIYPPAVNPDLLSQAEVKALNKLRDKSVETSLDFGLVWAERGETVKLFTDATQGLLRLANAIRRKQVSEALDVLLNDFRMHASGRYNDRRARRDLRQAIHTSGSLLERMSNVVLAWNLGISPLLKDLQAAQELLQTGLLTKDWNIKSVSKYSRTVNDRDYKKWPNTGVVSTTTFSELHGYTVTLIGRPRFTTSALLGQLGLSNIPSLAYQATSLTFIVDYFYALGPWLEALGVPGEFDFQGGSWTQKVSRVVTQEISSSGGVMKGNYVLNYVRRRLYSSFPLPLPPLSLREKDLTDKQLLNTGLVALNKLKSLLRS